MGCKIITACQVCGNAGLQEVFFAGYLPQVNVMQKVGELPQAHNFYPAMLLFCNQCQLLQLGCHVDREEVFPYSYAYRSGTTRLLRDNFADLAAECVAKRYVKSGDLVVDVGCNDGTLLRCFRNLGCLVCGIEPTAAASDAVDAGISVRCGFLNWAAADDIRENGSARLITACNVFAHIPDVRETVRQIDFMLADDGVFVIECHDGASMLATLQYDCLYHEHCYYWTMHSLANLLHMHGMEIIDWKPIPTHGGSLRVYSARKGVYPAAEIDDTDGWAVAKQLCGFAKRVADVKNRLWWLLAEELTCDCQVFGIGCPSRSVTLMNYIGLDEGVVGRVCEVPGSPKIGHYVPGTRIPIVDEKELYEQQPAYAMLFSWHLKDELIHKLRQKGFAGKFVVPLPDPTVIY